MRIEVRYAEGDEALPKYAAELVALAPDVLVAGGGTAAEVLKVTRTIPLTLWGLAWSRACHSRAATPPAL